MNPAGFSEPRSERMHDVIAGYVSRGEVPGFFVPAEKIERLATQLLKRSRNRTTAIFDKAAGGQSIVPLCSRPAPQDSFRPCKISVYSGRCCWIRENTATIESSQGSLLKQ